MNREPVLLSVTSHKQPGIDEAPVPELITTEHNETIDAPRFLARP